MVVVGADSVLDVSVYSNRSRRGDWAGWKPTPQEVPPHFWVRQNRPNYDPSAWP
jgi:hypothetical protein